MGDVLDCSTAGRRLISGACDARRTPFPLPSWIGDGRRKEKRLGIGVARIGGDQGRRSSLFDLSAEEDRDLVADMFDHRHVMRDEQVAEAALPLQVGKQVEDLGLNREVQRAHGLVADNDLRVGYEGAGD